MTAPNHTQQDYDLVCAQLVKCTRAMLQAAGDLTAMAEIQESVGNLETAKSMRRVAKDLSDARAAECLPPYNAFDIFRAAALRTRNGDDTQTAQLANSGLGLAGEAGEVADLVKKMLFQGKIVGADEIKHELGDVLFYLDWIADLFGLSLQEVADANVDKLKRRYPEGFTPDGGVR